MNVATKFSVAALAMIAVVPVTAPGQTMMDGHRGVCSDCHVGSAGNRYQLNTPDSIVVFALDAFGFSKTIGTFDGIAGGFVFDPDDAENASVIASIDVTSLEMNDSVLNRLVLSERFLDAERHPLITYQSTAVERLDDAHLRVDGRISLGGIERPLSLAVELNKLEPHPLTGTRTAGLVATGRINRSDFAMTLGLPNIGDEIEFTVYAQGSLLE